MSLEWLARILDVKRSVPALVLSTLPFLSPTVVQAQDTPTQSVDHSEVQKVREIFRTHYEYSFCSYEFIQEGGTAELAKTLLSLRNPDGKLVFDFENSLVDYVQQEKSPELAVGLSKIINDEGNPLFTSGHCITEFRKRGKDVDDARRLAELRNHKGRSIFPYAVTMINYFDANGTIRIAEDLASLQTSDGHSFFSFPMSMSDYLKMGGTWNLVNRFVKLRNSEGKSIFTSSYPMIDWLKKGYTIEDAESLVQIPGAVFRQYLDMENFLDKGGNIEIAQILAPLNNRNDHILPSDVYSLIEFQEAGGTVEVARQLVDLKNKKGDQFYNSVPSMIPVVRKRIAIADIQDLLELETESGTPFLEEGFSLSRFIKAGYSCNDIYALLSIVDHKRKPVFSWGGARYAGVGSLDFARNATAIQDNWGRTILPQADDVIQYVKSGRSLDDLNKLAGHGLDNVSIRRYLAFGLSVEEAIRMHKKEFIDTAKPNAFIAMGPYDPLRAFEVDSGSNFIKRIRSVYDTFIVFPSNRKQLFSTTIPNCELFILAGHGYQEGLILGEKTDEERELSVGDIGLVDYISDLDPRKIFLLSCKTGEGRDCSQNFANYMFTISGGKYVISSTDSFAPIEVQVNSLFPFKARIIKDGDDVTYIPGGDR